MSSPRTGLSAEPASHDILVFHLGGEHYGVAIRFVRELRPYQALTALANAPPHVKGVINLRGEIVPILDLRLRLGLADPVYDKFTTVIILELAARKVGVVVDGVSDVVALAPEDIRPAPCLGEAGAGAPLLDGIGLSGVRMLLLTNIASLLCFDEQALGLSASSFRKLST